MSDSDKHSTPITLCVCGDVMTGRGIDQILPHPSDPRLYETYVKSALDYVELAEQAHGVIPRAVDAAYIWGDALKKFEQFSPDVRIINLETSVTTRNEYWRAKGINYRMNPANIPCLTVAQIDCCVLANNHVLDWGAEGLVETLDTLKNVRIQTAGAGRDRCEAEAPAVMEVRGKGRVLVFSFGLESSGIPKSWAASATQPGVNLLRDVSDETVRTVSRRIRAAKQQRDIVVASLHWGGNWGYEIPLEHVDFAHKLIDDAGVDVVHGHSTHHPIGIEVYRGKPILYGCGDFLDDYEGISGYESFRDDLGLMYCLKMDPLSGTLVCCDMTPTQVRRFCVNRASKEDAVWLRDTLHRESARFGVEVAMNEDGRLMLQSISGGGCGNPS